MEEKEGHSGIKFLDTPMGRHLVEQEAPTNKMKEEEPVRVGGK